MRTCRRCGTEKPLSEYNRKGSGYQPNCRPCCVIRQWEIRYGITEQDYHDMLEAQGGVCAICKGDEDRYNWLPVDHDHESGKVRGLLCSSCNHLLGNAKDNPEILRAAIRYLEAFVG